MKCSSWLFCGLSFLITPMSALATLGEPLATIQTDASQLKASQKAAVSTEQYTSSEMYADGNTIKQYANREGIVFAVTWNGISKPDLTVLFGGYFNEYNEASNHLPKQIGVKALSFKTSQLVIRRSGRMRNQTGLAYIPSLVPAGVVVEDLP